ncbi:MAG: bifunctional glutamate N-acetyltransferase/amino-acid acetyltransferase ArgJ [Lentisphaeria bacterium]|nr:bifunctional glutamate N-acetyltransferase/amino-acid acetyltransferase ArgJ [Lentisphaeria bacterium]
MIDMEFIENGSVTSVPGFQAAGVTAGFKKSGAPDFALVFSELPASFAGVFTSCTFAAAPVLLGREKVLKGGTLRAFAINSGNANACTGAQGLENARKSCEIAAEKLGIPASDVVVASTGRIGVQMDMSLIEKGFELAVPALSAQGGNDAARAIMTTDTVPKAVAVKVKINGVDVTVGAMTKGAGMIDPKLIAPHATMLCCIATDACADNGTLASMLLPCAQDSFNRITVDGDMSTNDTVILMANGKSGVKVIPGSCEYETLRQALLSVMQKLAREMVMDGEGATKFVTVKVVNARSDADARLAAEAVANSVLCKTAWFGNDPNWGRVVAALGYSGAEFDPGKCNIYYDETPVVRNGGDAGTPESDLLDVVKKREFAITCDFGEGQGEYWVWSSDLSHEYVTINADYHT